MPKPKRKSPKLPSCTNYVLRNIACPEDYLRCGDGEHDWPPLDCATKFPTRRGAVDAASFYLASWRTVVRVVPVRVRVLGSAKRNRSRTR